MTELVRIRIKNLRNLGDAELEVCSRINLIHGENGSGKTSLLEAIHLLGVGRSFRSHQVSPVISLGATESTVYGKITRWERITHDVGITKSRDGEARVRVDGMNRAIADIAKLMPLIVVSPESFELLNSGPKERRHYLDWGVFHVEPSYIEIWRNYQRILKQRNSLLRRARIDFAQLAVWNKHLAEYAEIIDDFRSRYAEALEPRVVTMLRHFLSDDVDIRLQYTKGWPRDKELIQVLETNVEKDQVLGRTYYGPHRCDLRIIVRGLDAREHLSRGQQKIVICALKLAQGLCFAELTGERSIYLVDDLRAELDEHNARTFCHLLEHLNTQVFVTSLSHTNLEEYWNPDVPFKLFHVEHGIVRAVPSASLGSS